MQILYKSKQILLPVECCHDINAHALNVANLLNEKLVVYRFH